MELSLQDWKKVISDAHALGCKDFHISGGEPILYPGLIDLIQTAVKLGMRTNINTNGSRINLETARKLAETGLEGITVSLYSWRADVHDSMRVEKGLFERAVRAIYFLKEHTDIRVDLQTILGKANLLEFDKMMAFAYDLKAGNLYVSYMEGEKNNPWLPTKEQIRLFRTNVMPKVLEVIRQNAPPGLQRRACEKVQNMFSDDPTRRKEFSEGHYFPNHQPKCSKPYNFALILASGEVHPCNGVEYSHEPIMGNVQENELREIWENDTWERFRLHRHDWCHECPVTLHFSIPITKDL
jgi:MoaA/NifB/PqqE/SkfB family radical SAM enzyme